MTALIVIGSILLFFALILSLRAKITVEYNGEVVLTLRVLFFNIRILPKKQKRSGPRSMSAKKAERLKRKLEKKAQKKREKSLLKKQKKQEKKAQKKKGAKKERKLSLSDVLDIMGLVKDALSAVVKTFFGHLRIDLARLHVNVATGDAASTAIAYGAISDALTHLFYVLESVKGFDLPDTQDVSLNADFLSEKTEVDIKISFSLRVWHVFHVAFAALGKTVGRLVKMYSRKQSKHKIQ